MNSPRETEQTSSPIGTFLGNIRNSIEARISSYFGATAEKNEEIGQENTQNVTSENQNPNTNAETQQHALENFIKTRRWKETTSIQRTSEPGVKKMFARFSISANDEAFKNMMSSNT